MLEQVILAPHAIKRLIEPDEVARAVTFLLGPAGCGVHRRAVRDGRGLDRPLRGYAVRERYQRTMPAAPATARKAAKS